MPHGDEHEIATDDGGTTREALRQRISVLAPGILLVREYPRANEHTWGFMASVAAETGEQFENYVMVVDLSEAKTRPKGRYLETIRGSLRDLLHPQHLAFVQPGSILLRSVMRFVITGVAEKSSVHRTIEEALAAARKALEGKTVERIGS